MSSAEPAPVFIDWWFAPWRLGGPAMPEVCLGELARRDSYRHWCRSAGVLAELPAQAQWEWQAVAGVDGAILLRAAELFGGLLAARHQRRDQLMELTPARRRWCLAVALTQPLTDWSDGSAPAEPLRQRGLREFALRAESALPGLWSRLALLLPAPAAVRLPGSAGAGPPARERDRRCWLMCVERARQLHTDNID